MSRTWRKLCNEHGYGGSSTKNLLCTMVATAAILSGTTQTAWAWATAEHVRFGMKIAETFEGALGERLPVIEAPQGLKTFGHYVSAPDFARGLTKLLFELSVHNDGESTPCGVNWNPEGVVDGEPIHDQLHADADEQDLLETPGLIDCVNGWRLNNSHFGDFAANHYKYYHLQALEAARRYRTTRQESCREAAYTLEGWGQHYLTDSVAAGHAWNPAGTYDIEEGFQTLTGVQRRMAIHDYLNEHGARMAGAQYDDGMYWGDQSQDHTESGLSVPEDSNSIQAQHTMRLSQMGLGEVVASAECGANPSWGAIFSTRDPSSDPRRFYASNQTMCDAFIETDIADNWLLDYIGIDMPEVRAALEECNETGGFTTETTRGDALAKHYFQDRYFHFREHAMDGYVSPTIDEQAQLTLEELDCFDDAEVVPLAAPGASDVCGNELCEVPIGLDSSCPRGTIASGGCCSALPPNGFVPSRSFVSQWQAGPAFSAVELATQTPNRGGAATFIWINESVEPFVSSAATQAVESSRLESLGPTGELSSCGTEANVAIFEAKVSFNGDPSRDSLELLVGSFDDALRVQVDGHVVAYLTQSDLSGDGVRIPLLTTPGDSTVRLTHVNDCNEGSELEVAFAMGQGKLDALSPTVESGGGCRTGGDSGAPWMVLLFAGVLWRLRRSRRLCQQQH